MIRKLISFVLAFVLCLSLAACSGSDNTVEDDWRENGAVRAEGTITRGSSDIEVLVVLFQDKANFYFDDSRPVICEQVFYPVELQCDPDEAFQSIDFSDRNGDGNSDVALLLEIDGEQYLMVWFWDDGTEEYVFQPEESQIDGLINDKPVPEGLEGIWYLEGYDDAESVISIDADDNWILYDNTDGVMEEIDRGTIREVNRGEWDIIYAADSETFEDVTYNFVWDLENNFHWGIDGNYGLYERLDW